MTSVEDQIKVGSHSGLVRLLGEQVCPQGHREFESHTHRREMFLLNNPL